MNLNECRKKIDELDIQILALLNCRARISREIGSLKTISGMPITDEHREAEILQRLSGVNSGDLADEAAARIFRQILAESRAIQGAGIASLSTRLEIQ